MRVVTQWKCHLFGRNENVTCAPRNYFLLLRLFARPRARELELLMRPPALGQGSHALAACLRPDYPLLGCVPAEPNSVSPGSAIIPTIQSNPSGRLSTCLKNPNIHRSGAAASISTLCLTR